MLIWWHSSEVTMLGSTISQETLMSRVRVPLGERFCWKVTQLLAKRTPPLFPVAHSLKLWRRWLVLPFEGDGSDQWFENTRWWSNIRSFTIGTTFQKRKPHTPTQSCEVRTLNYLFETKKEAYHEIFVFWGFHSLGSRCESLISLSSNNF